MKQVILRNGEAVVEEVPPPIPGPKEVLVQNAYSVISSGTEMSSLSFSGEPLWKKIMHHPEKVAKGVKMIKEKGFFHTQGVVEGMFKFGQTTGYSCAGRVITVGEEVQGIKEGDFVACAGAGYANHAEIVSMPINLVAKIPEGVLLLDAASTTIGAIALQGVRQADLKVGESALVLGLGLLGQLTVQILRIAGVRVFGIDLDSEKVRLARGFGMEWGGASGGGALNEIMVRTKGHGVDATIICAATSSDEPINQAMEYTRKRGKIVIVGAVGLSLKRSPWYEKEIDLRISTSYGPGRYDALYEEGGVDYPYPYVRWTENRNMEAYLELLREKKINFSSLIGRIYTIEKAQDAYTALQTLPKPLAQAIEYKRLNEMSPNEREKEKIIVLKEGLKKNRVSVALVGTGQFATSTHLPNLGKLKDVFHLRAVVNRDGAKALQYAKQYGADYAASDYKEVLNDGKVDAVIITTRHNTHAKMVLEGLRAGKHVFVEKPLCLNKEELVAIEKFFSEGTDKHFQFSNSNFQSIFKFQPSILMVGYNRRFSPYAQKIREAIRDRKNPLIIHYRVNAGYIPREHWIHGEEGGGRIIGEGCHFLDFFNYLVGLSHKSIETFSITPKEHYYYPDDNFVVMVKYGDGSVANLIYTAMGGKNLPKEYVEVYSDGKTFIIDDYKKLKAFGSGGGFRSMMQDKGHCEELKQFAKAIKEGGEWPISLDDMIRATEQSFIINNQVKK